MPWKEETKMSIKQKFIDIVLKEDVNFSKLCSDFQISRACGYKWLKRFEEFGKDGLLEKSRRPFSSPEKTPERIEKKILQVRDLHPAWGGRKIHAYLERKGVRDLPNPSTITRILKRHHKIENEASNQAKAFIRFEHQLPNQLWQIDFKGFFYMKTGRCNPLTVLDDCSRFSLVLKACKNQQTQSVKEALIEAFREYGLPERMTMDNGSPWGCKYGAAGFTALEIWLILLGINPTHSRPYHPQTQGKDERFHRTLKAELLKGRSFESIDDAQKNFDWWREMYNTERPHEALGMRPPSLKYERSQREYPEVLPELEYEMGSKIRVVQQTGQINFKAHRYHICQGMVGLPVKIVETSRDGIMEVYLGQKKIKELDLRNKTSARKIIENA